MFFFVEKKVATLIVLSAVALVMIFEGIMPFLSPALWRKVLLMVVAKSDQVLRTMGGVSLCAGTLLMYMVHSGALS